MQVFFARTPYICTRHAAAVFGVASDGGISKDRESAFADFHTVASRSAYATRFSHYVKTNISTRQTCVATITAPRCGSYSQCSSKYLSISGMLRQIVTLSGATQ